MRVIPEGVMYSKTHNTFIDARTKQPKDAAFHENWMEHKLDFPKFYGQIATIATATPSHAFHSEDSPDEIVAKGHALLDKIGNPAPDGFIATLSETEDSPEEKPERYSKFQKELESLINRYSMENHSDTPDFILAQFLTEQLKVFDQIVARRDKWYGHPTLQDKLRTAINANPESQLAHEVSVQAVRRQNNEDLTTPKAQIDPTFGSDYQPSSTTDDSGNDAN